MPDDCLASLRKAHGTCCCAACHEHGAKVVLPKRKRLCLNGDDLRKNHPVDGKLCDCVVIWCADPGVVPAAVELKSGRLQASKVASQLDGGARFIDEITSGRSVEEFLPVLVHQGIRPRELDRLKQLKIQFRGQQYPILLERTGVELENLLIQR